MPFLYDLRIILVASAEMPCFVGDSPITCMQLVSVCASWDVADWVCLEDTMSLLSLITVWACRTKDSSALGTRVILGGPDWNNYDPFPFLHFDFL